MGRTDTGKPTLGFLGLGIMGGPMSRRLIEAGYTLCLWNRNRAKMAALADLGGVPCDTPQDLAAKADIVFLCLTDGAAVHEVVLGSHGVAAGGGAGKVAVDFSTIGPDITQEIAAGLKAACGMDWVDAPVSGGAVGADKGTLSVMCGGAEDQVARLRPVLAPLATRVTHMGPVGAGQMTKLCNQLIVSANILAIAEAVALARKSGVDMEKLVPALTGGFADSQPLQIFGARMAAGTTEPVMGEIAVMLKDVRAVLAAASGSGQAVSLAEKVESLYAAAAADGHAKRDLAFLAEFLAAR